MPSIIDFGSGESGRLLRLKWPDWRAASESQSHVSGDSLASLSVCWWLVWLVGSGWLVVGRVSGESGDSCPRECGGLPLIKDTPTFRVTVPQNKQAGLIGLPSIPPISLCMLIHDSLLLPPDSNFRLLAARFALGRRGWQNGICMVQRWTAGYLKAQLNFIDTHPLVHMISRKIIS